MPLLETAVPALNIVWFLLITVLWIGFFFLEGFDFGVAMLLPVLGRDDKERRVMVNTIGPTWDGNEVWLLTAAGGIFAAFPGWYRHPVLGALPADAPAARGTDPARGGVRVPLEASRRQVAQHVRHLRHLRVVDRFPGTRHRVRELRDRPGQRRQAVER